MEHLEALESIRLRARQFPRVKWGSEGPEREKTRQTRLFRKLNKVLFAIVCASARLEQCANGEEGEKDFEECATRVVLMGRFDVASDDKGPGYFIECYLYLDEGIREKGKEGV